MVPKSQFAGFIGLEEVELPEGVTTIDSSAFLGCTGLCDLKLPQSLTEIRFQAFMECSSLRDLVLPDRLTLIAIKSRHELRIINVIPHGTQPTYSKSSFQIKC